MRPKRNFSRREGFRDANLIVIATEGRNTERIYFEGLSRFLNNPKVHIEVLKKLNDNSNPEQVLNQLNSFSDLYNLDENDELWMVIDRDYQSWKPQEIKLVAKSCYQKNGYYLALSNPAFELWLILHYIDCSDLPNDEKTKIFNNRKVTRKKTYTKKLLSDVIGGFNESNYNPCKFVSRYKTAIEYAIKLDVTPQNRWPDYMATRVYKLVKRITKR